MRLLGLSGSLRRASYNTALLRAAAALLPAGVELELYDYRDVPPYDVDLGNPETVERLKAAIAAADGILIASPEYNYGIPGVLKNALDWVSRPAYASVMYGKPTGVISASTSVVGGARAQQQIKTTLLGIVTPVFPHAEVCVSAAAEKLVDGRLVHEGTSTFLRSYLAKLCAWVPSAALPPPG